MAVVRWTNLICGALLVIAALVALVFLPDSIAGYAREPEDAWLGAFWIGLLGMLAALCFANAARSKSPPQFDWRTMANLAAVIALALLFVLGRDDPAAIPLLVLCALGPVAALLGDRLMAGKPSRYRSAIFVAVVGVPVIYLLRVVAHELSVDSCFDSGGVYIEQLQKCSYSQDEVDRFRPSDS
jgi:hypothetical protein